jgi:hypothetical protein
MRAIIMHIPTPDRSQIQSGYRGFLRDAGNLIQLQHRLGADSWLIPEADYQALEPQLVRLCATHAVTFVTLEVETKSPWRQRP